MEDKTLDRSLLVWIYRLGWVCSITSGILLFTLISNVSFAQPPGFQKGERNFTNPFSNAQAKTQPNAQKARPSVSPPVTNPRTNPSVTQSKPRQIQVQPPGTRPPKDDVPEPKVGSDGIEVGGDKLGGVIPASDAKVFQINENSGIGSNAVITDFNYPDVDLIDLAKTIGKLTGKNFIFDKNVKGRISVVSNSPITVQDAWRAFLTALDVNGMTLIPSGQYIRIARQRDARDKQLNTYVGNYAPDIDALITRVFALKYISADEVARTFRSFMPANSRIIPYPQTNTVIVTDTGSNISKLAKMLEFLDVEGFDAGIEVVAVKYASAVEMAKLIDSLIPGTETGNKSRRRSRSRSGTNFSARRTKEGGVINTIIADERTNSLIINANNKGVEQILELVTKLDKREPAMQGGGKIHVLYLQFADAEEIAKTLNELSSGSSSSSRRTTRRSSRRSNPIPSKGLFEGSIKVAPDKATNSVVITASPSDFVTVQRVIEKLDIPRDEVYVEVIILEQQIGKDFTFSSNVALPNIKAGTITSANFLNFLTNPLSQRGLVLPFAGGKDVELDLGNGNTQTVKSVLGLIQALQVQNKVDIIATPQILTLDNKEASIEITEGIPTATTTTTQTAGTTASITKQNIGLTLKIKPQINKISNFIKLEVNVTLEDIQTRELPAAVVSQGGVATFSRKAETSVVVADSDTVVLGGLVRDKQEQAVAKVPILGDIPLLGWLFKSTTSQKIKSNLILMMTPHVVRKYEKIREILDMKFKQRDEFIERALGGKDPLRKYRDDIIRSLPNIKDAAKEVPTRSFDVTGDREPDSIKDPLKEEKKTKVKEKTELNLDDLEEEGDFDDFDVGEEAI